MGSFSVEWMRYQGISGSSEKLVKGQIDLDARSRDRLFFMAAVFKLGIAPTRRSTWFRSRSQVTSMLTDPEPSWMVRSFR